MISGIYTSEVLRLRQAGNGNCLALLRLARQVGHPAMTRVNSPRIERSWNVSSSVAVVPRDSQKRLVSSRHHQGTFCPKMRDEFLSKRTPMGDS